MTLYLDTSALAKRYMAEEGSEAVRTIIEEAQAVGTAIITHAELTAALTTAIRTGRVDADVAADVRQDVLGDWANLQRIQITDGLVVEAGDLAWNHGLRGYDAVQLAAALAWRETIANTDERFLFACFDNQLREAARAETVDTWPG